MLRLPLFLLSLLLVLPALAENSRFVRIELYGGERTLTLAEVEVIAGGKNVALKGTAKQSSTGFGGEAKRAIDGNKSPAYGSNGQTHTDFQRDPWWELDLGVEVDIERVDIWTREESFQGRLNDFTIKLLDARRKEVAKQTRVKAPQAVVRIDFSKGKPAVSYLTRAMKKGGEYKGGGDTGSPPVPAVEIPAGYKDPAPFGFREGDVVALLGNGLPDRFQHDGWFETMLQAGLTGRKVAFRNMSFPGDTVSKMPRSKGFTSMDDYLRHVKPTANFLFFGYNESWDGVDAADSYRDALVRTVNRFRGALPEGVDTLPRTVLFSPIAFENLNDPNLPDGAQHNQRLAAYARATKEAAEVAGCAYVDLFGPTLELFENDAHDYTINGLHLNEAGNREVAKIIASALLGKAGDPSKLGALRTAVQDKNVHWHNRFRAVDGNDVWGGRSGLKFVDGQTNREVLQQELVMFDVMTANRDKKVWAVAQGLDYAIDDSNVPAPIPVKSNVGGRSRSSNAQKEGTVKYLSPEESIAKIRVPMGYKLNVFASEEMFPDLANPVQLQVDGKGRIWAASWNTYPKWEPLKKMSDSLMIFEDTDGNGVADKRIRFADTHYPLGFEFWNGGVLVTCGPDLVFLKDTDGDDRADFRQVMLQGVGTSDTHHSANNLVYGPDGGFYWQSGIFLVNNFEHPWGKSLNTGSSGMYRFDPRRATITFHAGNSPNPHGTSFDYWGYCYANDGTGGRSYQVRPEGNGFRMHELLKKQVRPVAADQVVSSDNFPEDMQGDFLVCNTIGYLGLKHYKLHKDGHEATKRERGQVWGTPDEETENFLVSEDRNFRPTDAVFGEDGALYISDWQNVIIGHMQHNIRDPNRDHVHGRIIRMVNTARPLQKPVTIDGASVPQLLENLEHRVDGVRHRSRVELTEHPAKAVMPALAAWVRQFDATKAADAHHLLEALWVHQQFNVRNQPLLDALLESPEPHARIAAATVKHFWTVADPVKGQGGPVAGEAELIIKKAGIESDTAELTSVRINTLVEQLQYDLKEFEVKAGKKLRVTFVNPDYTPHNIVFVQPGAADEVATAALQLGVDGFAREWVPESDKVIVSSKMLDHGKEAVLEFTAPSKPGAYPYVCTFPGHALLMRGVMVVK